MKRVVQRNTLAAASFFLFIWLCVGAPANQSSAQDKLKTQGARDALTLYTKHCATCHGRDGRAKTFKAKLNGARNLTDAAWQQDASDERLFNSIANGRGKKMPAFSRKFSESEINTLVTFVRQLKKQ